jgi:hypothetical protein
MLSANRQLQWVRAVALLTTAFVIGWGIHARGTLGNGQNDVLITISLALLGLGLAGLASVDEANPRRLAAIWISLVCYVGVAVSWPVSHGFVGPITASDAPLLVFIVLGFCAALGMVVTYVATRHQGSPEDWELKWRDQLQREVHDWLLMGRHCRYCWGVLAGHETICPHCNRRLDPPPRSELAFVRAIASGLWTKYLSADQLSAFRGLDLGFRRYAFAYLRERMQANGEIDDIEAWMLGQVITGLDLSRDDVGADIHDSLVHRGMVRGRELAMAGAGQ